MIYDILQKHGAWTQELETDLIQYITEWKNNVRLSSKLPCMANCRDSETGRHEYPCKDCVRLAQDYYKQKDT